MIFCGDRRSGLTDWMVSAQYVHVHAYIPVCVYMYMYTCVCVIKWNNAVGFCLMLVVSQFTVHSVLSSLSSSFCDFQCHRHLILFCIWHYMWSCDSGVFFTHQSGDQVVFVFFVELILLHCVLLGSGKPFLW